MLGLSMKNERLLALFDCLLLEGKKTAAQLAARFEVSMRTIYRDIDSLSAAGLPVVAASGIDGGYMIDEDYRIDRSFLTAEEINDLTSLLRTFADATRDRSLERSLGKLSSLGSRSPQGRARTGTELTRSPVKGIQGQGTELAGSPSGALNAEVAACIKTQAILPPPFIAELSPWGPQCCDPRIIQELRRAIAERRVVSFRYIDAESRETGRVVEPFSVVIGGAAWYLHAWCRLRRAFRLFKLVRIRELRIHPERYDPYARMPIPYPFAFEGTNESLENIEVSVDGRLRQALDETFPGLGEGPDSSNRWTYRFDYPMGPYLVNLLLFYGPGLRVERPESLRRALSLAARAIAQLNSFSEDP
jgi:predicted DNA-binding transcriptional regulator YafY